MDGVAVPRLFESVALEPILQLGRARGGVFKRCMRLREDEEVSLFEGGDEGSCCSRDEAHQEKLAWWNRRFSGRVAMLFAGSRFYSHGDPDK